MRIDNIVQREALVLSAIFSQEDKFWKPEEVQIFLSDLGQSFVLRKIKTSLMSLAKRREVSVHWDMDSSPTFIAPQNKN